MQETLAVPVYQTGVLILSYVVSFVGAYAALSAAASIRSESGEINATSVLIAALALGGVAIWAMHFVGMMAYRLPVPIGYAKLETLISLVAAVVVSWCALRFMASGPLTPARLVVSGVMTGLGVAVMHYLGIYGMRFSGFFEWNWAQVGLSVAIAIVAATAALWLAFIKTNTLKRLGAALVMAGAVCTMHYTGIDAASPMCRAVADSLGTGLWFRSELEIIVPVFALAVSLMVIFYNTFKQLSSTLEPT